MRQLQLISFMIVFQLFKSPVDVPYEVLQYSNSLKTSFQIVTETAASVENLLYLKIRYPLGTVMSVTPSLPKEGEATQGEHPLDPRFRIFLSIFDEKLRVSTEPKQLYYINHLSIVSTTG